MTRVLVTGATTPIGRALIHRLVQDPKVEQVLAAGFEETDEIQGRVTYHRCDLARMRSMHDLMFGPVRQMGIEVIVHLALHRSARLEGKKVHALNVDATRELLRMAERHPTIRRFVFRSFADVYQLRADRPSIIGEEHPLELSPQAPQWVRDRVAADLTVCTAMGLSPLSIAVLRTAECLAPNTGSQLYDYLGSRVCLRPLGFDPMMNVISVADVSRGLALAIHSDAVGVFNIPGYDVLPLRRIIELAGRRDVPVPGPVVAPLYGMRSRVKGTEFRYDLNEVRFHLGGVLDGRRAKEVLNFAPTTKVNWTERTGTEQDPMPSNNTEPRSRGTNQGWQLPA